MKQKQSRQHFCAPAEHQSDQFRSTLIILGGRGAERIMGGGGKRLSWKLLSEAHSWSPWKPVY